MTERSSEFERRTTETRVKVRVDLDGSGRSRLLTGIGFFDHMLTALAATARLDLEVEASGDLAVDAHHTVEDVGLTLGEALRRALDDGRGIARYGWATVPMDEALVQVALDLSGRPYAAVHGDIPARTLGSFHTDLMREWLWALARSARGTVHLRVLAGTDAHHIIEAAFKALGLALGQAVTRLGGGIPSTKGTLFS